jgi:predicted RNA-binding protein
MSYWLIPIQEDDWLIVLNEKVYGSKRDLSSMIKKGDFLIFYVSKYYARRYGGKITGIMEVISDWYKDERPLFVEDKVKGRAVLANRIKLREVVVGSCNLKDILSSVTFIEDKYQLAKYLRNAPANLKRPIPERDAELISACLKKELISEDLI